MKRTLFLITCIFYFSTSSGQETKTYHGLFSDGALSGTATYQYYEDENYERIFNGTFSLTSGDMKLNGGFKNNLRNGSWKITERSDESLSIGKVYLITALGSYKDGMLDGKWSYTMIEQGSNKIVQKTNATFKENLLVGKYEFLDNYIKDNLRITMYFDSTGKLDGTRSVYYKVFGIPYEEIDKYKNGQLFWALHRNSTTGEILYKLENKVENSKPGMRADDFDYIDDYIHSGTYFWFYKYDDYTTYLGCGRYNNPIYRFMRGLAKPSFNSFYY